MYVFMYVNGENNVAHECVSEHVTTQTSLCLRTHLLFTVSILASLSANDQSLHFVSDFLSLRLLPPPLPSSFCMSERLSSVFYILPLPP